MAVASHGDVRVAAMARWRMSGPIVLEGEFRKLNETTGATKVRYLVLYESVLIYRYRKNGRILGVIPVEILRYCGFCKDDQTGCCFDFILRGPTQATGQTAASRKNAFTLRASDRHEASAWVSKLKALQLRFERSEPAIDRHGRYWLKLGAQASLAVDGVLGRGEDSGSEWEAGDDSDTSAAVVHPQPTAVSPEKSFGSVSPRERQGSYRAKKPSQFEGTVIMEGCLHKRLKPSRSRVAEEKSANTKPIWVKRFFKLTDTELSYYLAKNQAIVGLIPLPALAAVNVVSLSTGHFTVILSGQSKSHTFDLLSDPAELLSKWIQELQTAMAKFKNVPIEFSNRGKFWLTLAAKRRGTFISEEESNAARKLTVSDESDDDDFGLKGLSLTNDGTAKSRACPFYSFFSHSSQGFVLGMDKCNQDITANVQRFGSDDSSFFAVFDGHGPNGHLVSGFLRQRLPSIILSVVDTNTQSLQVASEGYSKAFRECNDQLMCSLSGQLDFSGSVAVICHLQRFENQVYLWSCNLGDCRAVLAKQASDSFFLAVPLSCDHLPTNPWEKRRIEEAGGRVGPNKYGKGSARVWLKDQDIPGLSVTRAFGDLIAHRVGILPEPEVWVRTLVPNDHFIIVATDGLWEFITCQEAVEVVSELFQATGERNAEKAAKALVTAAEHRWAEEETESRDDITATVIFL